MLRGYQESRALLTALELDIFTAVGTGATAEQTARKACTHPRATETLLNALTAMGVLVKRDEVFVNTPETERYFVEGSKDNARPGLLHVANLWHHWSTLTDCVRAGTAVRLQTGAECSERWTRDFIAAMHYNALERAPGVVKAVGAQGVERMLDVGGGSAAYAIAFAQANERLHATVLDRADVLPIAQRNIAEAGLTTRIETRLGDLQRDRLGTGFDLVLVSAVGHILSPEENQDLLRRCFEALVDGGRIVIREFILDSSKTAPKEAALFGLNMLVGTPTGGTYSFNEHAAWMRAAGFQDIRHIGSTQPTSLIVGTRE